MTQSPPRRKTVKLPDSFHQRLNMYALAAGAAGVGMLALTQHAEAKIVYTKTHHVIGRNSSFALDLNHDGTIDFQLGYYYRRGTSGFLASVRALPASRKGNQIEGTTAPYRLLAAALKPGARITQSPQVFCIECDHGPLLWQLVVHPFDYARPTFGQLD